MKISEKNNVYIELTNPVHGGEGWELGEVLWSPVASSWKIMKEIKPGDVIIHSVSKSTPHDLIGVSRVKRSVAIVQNEPLKPGKWKGYNEYYKIELQEYSGFKNKMPHKEFFSKYEKEIIALGDKHSFYALSKDKKTIVGAAQKYIAKVPVEVQELLTNWFESKSIELFDNVAISNDDDTDSSSEEGPRTPGRVTTTTERIIRDTLMIKNIKAEYDNVCQICGKKIKVPNGNLYSEGHHLKKLGGVHEGPDTRENVMILCPFHHAEFDYGSMAINPDTMLVEHIDANNEFHWKELAYVRTDLGEVFLKYHYKTIFNK